MDFLANSGPRGCGGFFVFLFRALPPHLAISPLLFCRRHIFLPIYMSLHFQLRLYQHQPLGLASAGEPMESMKVGRPFESPMRSEIMKFGKGDYMY